jgi:hypothetical protein
MDVVERGIISLWGADKFWGIPITSFSNHLNGKIESRKIGPLGVLTKEEDEVVVACVLSMQECGLSITLQQFKWKMVEITQTQPTPFKNGVHGDS